MHSNRYFRVVQSLHHQITRLAMPSPQHSALPDALRLVSKGRFAELYDFTEGVVVADRLGRIVFGNTSANTLLGRVALGVNPDDYSHHHGIFTEDGRPYPSTDLPLARAVLSGETVEGDRLRVRRPDGSTILVICYARPIYRDDGQQEGGMVLFHQVP
jgi:PAS domain-containing protein